jgi:hypothetical protein
MNYKCISVPYVQQKRETRAKSIIATNRRHGWARGDMAVREDREAQELH